MISILVQVFVEHWLYLFSCIYFLWRNGSTCSLGSLSTNNMYDMVIVDISYK